MTCYETAASRDRKPCFRKESRRLYPPDSGLFVPIAIGAASMQSHDSLALLTGNHFHSVEEPPGHCLKEILARLRRSNEELERFAATASHDLQEPLRTIATFLTLLAEKSSLAQDETTREYLRIAIDAAERMRALVNQLLEYSRVGGEEPRKEEFDSFLAVDAALRELGAALTESEVRVVIETLPRICANPLRFRQLFQNLLSNAVKYRRAEGAWIRITAHPLPEAWLFSVADNGMGIAKEHQSAVFEPFRRLHARGKIPGTGMGLAICKRIVEEGGGRLWVESEPGRGSIFRFTVPY